MQSINTHGLTDLGFKILIDRYAKKDMSRKTIKAGDLVVAILDSDKSDIKQRRELGWVNNIDGRVVTIDLPSSEETIQLDLDYVDLPTETSPSEIQARVARGIASVETTKETQKTWEGEFKWLLNDWRFVPGGRILAMAGADKNLTAYNCYVLPIKDDSRNGIMETLTGMTELMSRGGGVGINVSTLRPRNAYVKGVNGRSSGSVSWASLFSYVTGLIEQGGSRRGALMIILNDFHPDVLRFINAKRKAEYMTNCNISVGVSDAFMSAVKNNEDWQLRFPDTTHPAYGTEWNGVIEQWEAKGYPVKVYETLPAREIWDAIIESAWTSAEPGLWFRTRANEMSNSNYFDTLLCTNPCGEIGLGGYGVCNLGSINLPRFFDGQSSFNQDELRRAVIAGVRFLDNVIDYTSYHLPETEIKQKNERRVGLGVLGLAELLIQCGIRYGSERAISFTEELFKFIATTAYEASISLASEKGSFPALISDKFLESGYAKKLPVEIRRGISQVGIRNVALLMSAPTGSTGTMINTSTGIEPFFSWNYYRKGRLGLHEERANVVMQYLQQRGITVDAEGNSSEPYTLPDYFVTAMELTPNEHAAMQGAAQQWVDQSISKTVNAPNDYTIEQTSDLYMYLYDLGCKGGTIYRDGSRSEQVLILKEEKPNVVPLTPEQTREQLEQETAAIKQRWQTLYANHPEFIVQGVDIGLDHAAPNTTDTTVWSLFSKREAALHGITVRGETPYGTVYITVNEDEDGHPFEVFISVGRSGTDIQAQGEALGRLMSLSLQMLPTLNRTEALRILTEQIRGIGGARSYGMGKKRVASFPDAVAKVLEEEYLEKFNGTLGSNNAAVVMRDLEAFGQLVEFAGGKSLSQEAILAIGHDVSQSPYGIRNGNGKNNEGKKAARTALVTGRVRIPTANTCPSCGNLTLLRVDGCAKCDLCGHSEC